MARDRGLLVASSGALVPETAAGEDLALLSLTDHVITTRGTFSKWAAQLATCGGRYVGESRTILLSSISYIYPPKKRVDTCLEITGGQKTNFLCGWVVRGGLTFMEVLVAFLRLT